MDITKFRTNKVAERNGVWVEFKDGDGRAEFLIASTLSPEYRKVFNEEIEAVRRDKPKPTDEDFDAADCRVYARAILLGWRGVTAGTEDLAYSVQAATDILLNAPAVRNFVRAYAQSEYNFRESRLAEAKAVLGKS